LEESILNKIRIEYENKKNIQNEYKKNINRLKELEENELIKEYLILSNIIKDKNYLEILTLTDEEILNSLLLLYSDKIEKTNNIIVYLATFAKSKNNEYIKVNRDNSKAEFRMYADLEKDISLSINIPIKEADEYEKNNNVIIPQTIFTDLYFYDLQKKFMKEAILSNQKQAIVKILK